MTRRAESAERPRERNAEATRTAILGAARKVFARDGFGVGVREVATEAGVNAALLNRYFGSKEELFAQAVGDGLDLKPVLEGPRREFGDRVARYALASPSLEHDPIGILLRSSSHQVARELFRSVVDSRIVQPLAEWLGGAHAHERALLIAGEILGLAVLKGVVYGESFSVSDDLIAYAARAIQSHVTTR